MPWATIAPRIAIILTAAGCVNIQQGTALCRTWKEFFAQFQSGTSLEGWTIGMSLVPADGLTNTAWEQRETYTVRGFKNPDAPGVQTNYAAMQAKAELVRQGLRRDYKLGGAADYCDPPQQTALEHRDFGGILVLYCQIDLVARVRVT